MSEQPSAELLAQLEQLGLATAEQVAAMRPRVRKLAGKLPWFDSLWVDALRQSRLVTPYQATELCAGRGEQLRAAVSGQALTCGGARQKPPLRASLRR